ncbi:MAG: Tad domain-containing protein [Novosphingobium sp.]|nr:Tad domain-containing protein [Novosphingobium sp.]MCP5403491.1 Tad domain-containing protein [Novosphingobium sp.]
MAEPKTFLGTLVRSRAGNVLPMAAVGILVSAALVGGGIDMSRAYRVENRLQAACDAAVLAGRKNVSTNGFNSAAQAQADAYFETNFDEGAQEAHDTTFEATSPDNGNTVNGVADTTLDSAVMRIFGFDQFDLEVNCSASMGVGNSDVVMVLDTTGSMGNEADGSSVGYGETSRMQDLQAAMKNFYDTLSAATNGTNSRIRYGFVPYSQSINVGQLIYDQNPNYLADSHDYQSRQAIFVTWVNPVVTEGSYYTDEWSAGSNNYGHSKYNSESWCESNLPSDTDWQDYGSADTDTDTDINGSGQQVETDSIEQRQRRLDYYCSYWGGKWRPRYRIYYRDYIEYTETTSDPVYSNTPPGEFHHWEYKQVTYDTSTFKTFSSVSTYTGYNGSLETSTWNGCIEERQTVSEPSFSFSTLLGLTPTGADDLDIDSAPDVGDDATKWAPLWQNIAYNRENEYGNWTNVTVSDYGDDVSSVCPHQAQLLAEMTETEFDNYADSLSPSGNTYHDLGMIWGARLSSPDGIFADNVNADPPNGGEVSRHIIFMTDGEMCPKNTTLSAYGIEYHDRRVTDDGGSNCGGDQANRHSSRFLAVCAAAKAKGIRVWVIAFGTSLTTNLQTCASSSSSYTASSSTQLNTAFQEIANQVGELRLIQ